jgi:hypothetical protein
MNSLQPCPLPRPARAYVSIYPGPGATFLLNVRGPLGTYEVRMEDVGHADANTVAAMAVNHLLDQRVGTGWDAFDPTCELRFHTAEHQPMDAPALQPGVRSLGPVAITRRHLGAFEGTPVAFWLSPEFPVSAVYPLAAEVTCEVVRSWPAPGRL